MQIACYFQNVRLEMKEIRFIYVHMHELTHIQRGKINNATNKKENFRKRKFVLFLICSSFST